MQKDQCCILNGVGCSCNEEVFACMECGVGGKDLFCSAKCYEQYNNSIIDAKIIDEEEEKAFWAKLSDETTSLENGDDEIIPF